jgi:hypothetical protein
MTDGWLVQVRDKIVAVLQSGSSSAGVAATSMFAGVQMKRTYPYLYVAWKGGPISTEAMTIENWLQDFEIVIVDSVSSGNAAENNCMNTAENVIVDLKANPTLSGLVTDGESVKVDGETFIVGTEWGKVNEILAATRVTWRVTARFVAR